MQVFMSVPLLLNVRRALEAVLTELARVRLHGFSEREFNNAVKGMQVGTYLTSIGDSMLQEAGGDTSTGCARL